MSGCIREYCSVADFQAGRVLRAQAGSKYSPFICDVQYRVRTRSTYRYNTTSTTKGTERVQVRT